MRKNLNEKIFFNVLILNLQLTADYVQDMNLYQRF